MNDGRGQAAATFNLGLLYHHTFLSNGDKELLAQASKLYRESRDHFLMVNDFEKDSRYRGLLSNLAAVLLEERRYDESEELYQRVVDLIQEHGGGTEELRIAKDNLEYVREERARGQDRG